jgi:tetratricopeptide (TPR) repeat protein
LARGRPSTALQFIRRADRVQHAQKELHLGPAPLDRAAYLTVFAQLRQRQARGSEAYDLYAQALELIQSIARKHPVAAYCLDGLGEIDLEHGRLDQSEAHFRESRTIRQATLGESHREVAYSLDGLSRVAAARGKPEEAEALLREASAILERELESAHPDRIAVAGHLRRLARPHAPDHAAAPALQARFLAIPTLLTVGWQVLYIGKDWRIVESNIKRREAEEAKAAHRLAASSIAASTDQNGN